MPIAMTRDRLAYRLSEKPWRPADYPPLATDLTSDSEHGAAGKAFSVVTPEHVALVARLRSRVAAQERQLLKLSDMLQHLLQQSRRSVSITPTSSASMSHEVPVPISPVMGHRSPIW
jgi:hypothetical protein